MKTTTLDREIQAKVQTFVAELSSLVKTSALESVQQALGGTAVAARRPARARAGAPLIVRRRGAQGGKRSPEVVAKTDELVLTYVRAHQGQGVEELGKGLRMPTKELKLPIAKLVGTKKLKTKGQKRGTKYFVR